MESGVVTEALQAFTEKISLRWTGRRDRGDKLRC